MVSAFIVYMITKCSPIAQFILQQKFFNFIILAIKRIILHDMNAITRYILQNLVASVLLQTTFQERIFMTKTNPLTRSCNSIQFINKDNCWRILFCFFKSFSKNCFGLSRPRACNFWSINDKEESSSFVSNSLCYESLANTCTVNVDL